MDMTQRRRVARPEQEVGHADAVGRRQLEQLGLPQQVARDAAEARAGHPRGAVADDEHIGRAVRRCDMDRQPAAVRREREAADDAVRQAADRPVVEHQPRGAGDVPDVRHPVAVHGDVLDVGIVVGQELERAVGAQAGQSLVLAAAVAAAQHRAVVAEARRQVLLRLIVRRQRARVAARRVGEVEVVRHVRPGARVQHAVRGEVADHVPALQLELAALARRQVEDREVEVGAVALGVREGEQRPVWGERAERVNRVGLRQRALRLGEPEPVALVAADVAPEGQQRPAGTGHRPRHALGGERQLVRPAARGGHRPQLRDAGDVRDERQALAAVQPLRRMGAPDPEVRRDVGDRYHGISTPSRQKRPVGPPASMVASCSAILAACSGVTVAELPPMSVLAQPGCIAFTRIPSAARSLAAVSVNAFTAAFDSRYGSEPPLIPFVNWPMVDEITTIRACPARRSDGQERLREPERGQHVDGEARLDVGAARVGRPAAAEDAGVVHEHVERRRQRERLLRDRGDPLLAAQVAPYGLAAQILRRAMRVLGGARVAQEPRTLRPERPGDRRPEPPARPGDERGLSVQKHPGSVGVAPPGPRRSPRGRGMACAWPPPGAGRGERPAPGRAWIRPAVAAACSSRTTGPRR